MTRTTSKFLALIAVFLSPIVANADPIVYAPGGGTFQINFFEEVGQSFVAEDSFVEAGLFITPINPGRDDSDAILYHLYAGLGTGGALLASASFNLSEPFSDFFMVDFSATALAVGSTYTLTASIVGDSPLWGLSLTDFAPDNTGVCNGALPCIRGSGSREFALFVNPTIAVPEPGTLALLGIGLFGMGLARRRRTI